MMAHVDQESQDSFHEDHDEEWFKGFGIKKEQLSNDLYVILTDKAEGEALTRVRAAKKGRRNRCIHQYVSVVYRYYRNGHHGKNEKHHESNDPQDRGGNSGCYC